MKIKNTTYNNFDENIKCCVFTRAFYETPHINFFIEHYKKLGFDKIIILKTDNLNINYYQDSFVELHKVENLGDYTVIKYDYILKNSNYDWGLCIDLDEILLLNKKYKNIKSYIFNNLKKNENINTFYFRWGMIEKYDNLQSKYIEFNYIINNYSIYNNNFIKSMVKINEMDSIKNPHNFNLKNKNCVYFEDKIIIDNKYSHYISDDSYKKSILIHLHTRNLNNLILKSLLTVFNGKKINDNFAFKKLIINYRNYQDKKSIIEEFKKVIGGKAILPFIHSKKKKIDKMLLKNYNKYEYKYPITENLKEIDILKIVFNNFNINYDNYKNFIENINYFFE